METSRVLLVISIFCLTLCLAKHGKDVSVCSTPAQTSDMNPGPTIKIPDQFSVHVEIIEVEKKLTTTLTEYFDKINNRGTIFQTRMGNKLNAYYDYTTNELIQVLPLENNECMVDELSLDENNFLFGTTLKNGSARMFSGSQALYFGRHGIYQGRTTVRGIACEYWRICEYWPAQDATVNVDIYFTAKTAWNSATGIANVPVRVHAKGNAYDSDTEMHKLDQYFEYYHFRSGLPSDTTIMETPPGVYCPNRKIKKKLPEIPQTMSFYTEIVDKTDVIVATIQEEFDQTARLSRFIYKALPTLNLYNKNRVVDVHDFETGVSYVTNTVLGNCTARPIPQRSLDATNINAHDVRMSSGRDFLDFPGKDYSYEGIKTVRGIPAESWVGVRTGWPYKSSKQSVWEWYFAKDSAVAVTGASVEHAAPLQFRVSQPDALIDYDYNIYAYSSEQPDISSYDVSQCFLFHKREKFGISVPNTAKSLIESDIKKFKFFIITALATTFGLSPLRVQQLEIAFGEEAIFITFELVDVSPIVGDVAHPKKEVSLQTASKTIREYVAADKFAIVYFNGKKSYSIKVTDESPDDIEYKKMARKTTYSSKSMAGLGVVMTILGMVGGGGFAYYKCS